MHALASKIASLSIFFTQLLIQAQMKENIKDLRHWPPVTGEFPAQKGQ